MDVVPWVLRKALVQVNNTERIDKPSGGSNCRIQSTDGISKPLAATSVQIKVPCLALLKSVSSGFLYEDSWIALPKLEECVCSLLLLLLLFQFSIMIYSCV